MITMTKEQLSNKYAIEQYPYTENMRFQCIQHYESGWEDALENLWISTKERPKLYDKILVLYKIDGSYMISQTKYFGFVTIWKFGCNDIIAWMPIPSFDKILEDNKDVLKRLKGK